VERPFFVGGQTLTMSPSCDKVWEIFMPTLRITVFTCLALLAFAGNSLLCRMALKNTTIDAASFTSIRLVSAAVALWLILIVFNSEKSIKGNWPSAMALFIYAAGFSFAYTNLTAGTGALLLFTSVQISMIGFGLWRGERLMAKQVIGLVLALAGLLVLVLPGLASPPLHSALLMVIAGVSWGAYSLRGRGAGDATAVTTGNFLRCVPFAVGLSLLNLNYQNLDVTGIGYAIASGAVTSGMGYAIWYRALPGLKATQAATVQLSVPVIAAVGGVLLLGENFTQRSGLASVAIMFGIALVVLEKNKNKI
jgi:drug/metabolite transporter (DMT)-like permease